MTYRSFAVIGAGAWGTALAQTLRQAGRDVLIWSHRPEPAAEINSRHTNIDYLPGVALDPRVQATTRLADAAGCDAVLMVTPAQHMRAVATALAPHLAESTPVIICSKGLEQATGKLMSEVLAETLPMARAAVLSGPGFAEDVARGLPFAVTVASPDEAIGERLALSLGHQRFRPYWSPDVLGVQLGGAIKNVLAIAAGIVEGKALGASAHAGLVTRGFAELMRFGLASGARQETMMGLSGLGDLILTCGSPQSRNMSLGRALGQGRRVTEILAARRSVTEGVYTAEAVTRLAAKMGVEMPICQAVHGIVAGTLAVEAAIEGLLSRPFRAEA
jgi:glycerol-3-phosphate dehydrogenase (NAD(P)+)